MKTIYRIYQFAVVLPIGLLITLINSLVMGIGSMLFRSETLAYWPMRLWGASICRLLWLPVEVVGREKLDPKQSYVFIANHQGAFDIFLIAGFLHRPFKWMMKASLRQVPFVGWACEKAGFIFVDKSSKSGIVNTIKNACQSLKGGTSVTIFPEGARTFTGHMGQFRKGSFLIARQIGLPLVPITIDGAYDVLPRQRGFNFVNYHKLRLIIHDPIPADDEAIEKSYHTIMSGLPAHYQGYQENPDQ